MSEEDDSSAGSGGASEESGSEEDLKEESAGITAEDLNEDIATLVDLSKYIDETRNRISAKLLSDFGGPPTEPLAAPASTPDYSASIAYESTDERQRAMLLDKAIMLLMSDGDGKP